jgi:hypothetical protein
LIFFDPLRESEKGNQLIQSAASRMQSSSPEREGEIYNERPSCNNFPPNFSEDQMQSIHFWCGATEGASSNRLGAGVPLRMGRFPTATEGSSGKGLNAEREANAQKEHQRDNRQRSAAKRRRQKETNPTDAILFVSILSFAALYRSHLAFFAAPR